jgi:hypothetical protein
MMLLLASMIPCAQLGAHQGPPYPIFMDKATDPCLLSVWADPDVGIGTFYVVLDPRPGGSVPEDAAVEVRVQPTSGRLTEVAHPARRQPTRQRVQFQAEVPFDAVERWRVRVLVRSSRGSGEAVTEVDVTPPGLGPFDLVLYLFPFVVVASLWLRAALRRRAPSPPGSAPGGRTGTSAARQGPARF